MIKINKVDRLGEKEKKGFYCDLEAGDSFIFPAEPDKLVIKTANGHMWANELVDFTGDEHPDNSRKITLVDAEINWAYRGDK